MTLLVAGMRMPTTERESWGQWDQVRGWASFKESNDKRKAEVEVSLDRCRISETKSWTAL